MVDDILRENDHTLKQHKLSNMDALAKSSPNPAAHIVGTRVPFSAYYANVTKAV
jgi:hypothetical protein